MQADPFVQAPSNLQNYNRYSYVLNNPLSYTDPSGYFFKKLLKGAMKLSGSWYVYRFLNKNPLLRNLVNVGLNFVPGCTAWCSALFTGTSKFVESGSLGKAFKSGLTSYATAWAFSQIGDAFGAKAGFWKEGGIAHLGAHALTGGIISDVQGGNFGHGFWSAGLTKGAQVSGIVNMDNVVIGTAQSMVIAGTISKLTGGKFANAAVTGAFQYLYNAKGGKFSKAGKRAADALAGKKLTQNEKIVTYAQELMDAGFSAEEALNRANTRYSITTPYKRPSGATTPAQRQLVQGKACVDCGITTSKQVADHKTPLVKEYYETGTINKPYMKSLDAVQPQCPTCSAKQGAEMSRYSRRLKKELGL
ncbi:hypothetical protein N476_14600 [Pseudoalteromonas luteoviolacea H33]|uniref:Uncharacterized protein n=2 Tax=Pseudoalteromonas luteoviolacea TaxID=43657 RepID=A0A167EJY4_9GAMM|nr:hypothetical protein N476_14600 [Pseudoalteromonas luteoviolacea H33]KZN75542.1 hypothetical protein N477_18530 [Pseudoalteromonas luteoviolacea H33-S]